MADSKCLKCPLYRDYPRSPPVSVNPRMMLLDKRSCLAEVFGNAITSRQGWVWCAAITWRRWGVLSAPSSLNNSATRSFLDEDEIGLTQSRHSREDGGELLSATLNNSATSSDSDSASFCTVIYQPDRDEDCKLEAVAHPTAMSPAHHDSEGEAVAHSTKSIILSLNQLATRYRLHLPMLFGLSLAWATTCGTGLISPRASPFLYRLHQCATGLHTIALRTRVANACTRGNRCSHPIVDPTLLQTSLPHSTDLEVSLQIKTVWQWSYTRSLQYSFHYWVNWHSTTSNR